VDRCRCADVAVDYSDSDTDRWLASLETQDKHPFELVADHPVARIQQCRVQRRANGVIKPTALMIEDSLGGANPMQPNARPLAAGPI
jgi:hypothetical protein